MLIYNYDDNSREIMISKTTPREKYSTKIAVMWSIYIINKAGFTSISKNGKNSSTKDLLTGYLNGFLIARYPLPIDNLSKADVQLCDDIFTHYNDSQYTDSSGFLGAVHGIMAQTTITSRQLGYLAAGVNNAMTILKKVDNATNKMEKNRKSAWIGQEGVRKQFFVKCKKTIVIGTDFINNPYNTNCVKKDTILYICEDRAENNIIFYVTGGLDNVVSVNDCFVVVGTIKKHQKNRIGVKQTRLNRIKLVKNVGSV